MSFMQVLKMISEINYQKAKKSIEEINIKRDKIDYLVSRYYDFQAIDIKKIIVLLYFAMVGSVFVIRFSTEQNSFIKIVSTIIIPFTFSATSKLV